MKYSECLRQCGVAHRIKEGTPRTTDATEVLEPGLQEAWDDAVSEIPTQRGVFGKRVKRVFNQFK